MQIWGYCGECTQWYACMRGGDGAVADWACPVCGLVPVSVEQRDVADVGDDWAAPALDGRVAVATG